VAGPALAHEGQDHGKEVALTGWIVDKDCGAKNAGAEHKDCILACNKKGAPLVLASGEKIYSLSDQKNAKEHVGHEVVVKGTVDDAGNVTVASIEKAEEKG
jgi:hypothetical protein